MPRSHETAGMGHNGSPLSDDDLAALLARFGKDIRESEAEEEKASSLLKAARKAKSGHYKLLDRETGIKRRDFEALREAQDLDEQTFRDMEATRTRLFSLGGLPMGSQLDMFERGDGADQSAIAFEDGQRAGLRGGDPVPPDHVSGLDHPKWMEGWHKGQETLILRLGRAKEILDARGQPAGDAPVDLQEPEPDPTDEAAIRKAAKALKASAFMETGGPDADAGTETEDQQPDGDVQALATAEAA